MCRRCVWKLQTWRAPSSMPARASRWVWNCAGCRAATSSGSSSSCQSRCAQLTSGSQRSQQKHWVQVSGWLVMPWAAHLRAFAGQATKVPIKLATPLCLRALVGSGLCSSPYQQRQPDLHAFCVPAGLVRHLSAWEKGYCTWDGLPNSTALSPGSSVRRIQEYQVSLASSCQCSHHTARCYGTAFTVFSGPSRWRPGADQQAAEHRRLCG